MTGGRGRLVDLSHVVEDGLVTLRGFPAPRVTDWLTRDASRARYDGSTTFQIGRIDMVANTGTYVDAPSHRHESGADLAELPLERLAALPGLVVRRPVERGRATGAGAFQGLDVAGKAVLVHTGWASRWGTEAYQDGHPFLTRDAAEFLVSRGAALVGIDSLNVDDGADLSRPVHTLALGAGIPVAEHLTGLDGLPDGGFLFFAVPVKVRGMGTFPVRAFALVG